jgi:hypothetical protein
MDMDSEISKIQEKFFNDLISLKVSEKDALEITSTFFFAWSKKNLTGKDFDIKKYKEDIEIFLSKFKEKQGK